MPKDPNRTGRPNRVSGIYHSVCHDGERTILEGQKFPRCGYCNTETSWIFIRPVISIGESASASKTS
jgi:hypothetical protein